MEGIGLIQRLGRVFGGRCKRLVVTTGLCALMLAAVWLAGCGDQMEETLAPASPMVGIPTPASPIPDTHVPQSQTLGSLERIDDYPLYVMHYYSDYGANAQFPEAVPRAACSLFAALGDPTSLLYGRNFDWESSAAVLLYTYPSAGYASVSMVNLGFLGFDQEEAEDLLSLTEAELEPLLRAPYLPIDGMNEVGLAVGMAAVPSSEDGTDLGRPSIGSLGIMREMLDHAATVDEATAVMEQYTILFDGGPPVHYLIADATGRAVLVEFGTGQRHEIPNDQPWHMATNFLVESAGGDPRSQCNRYRTIAEELEAAHGALSSDEGMDLLERVSQEGTQWSAVYDISSLAVYVVMGRQYGTVHTFQVEHAVP